MKQSFEVGEQYRNRRGEYKVVGLDGSRMVIQYADGGLLRTTVEMQARIWRNIQAEERVEAVRSRKRNGKRSKFRGLRERDFQTGVVGTSWRARTGLGGSLAKRMSKMTPYNFQSYAIRRQAKVHIAQPAYYDKRAKWKSAKFILHLNAEHARYGFQVERNDGPMDSTWDWLAFLAALEKDTTLQHKLEAAMCRLNLCWRVCVEEGDRQIEQWAWPAKVENVSWSDFVSRLCAIESTRWTNVSLCTHMRKEEAVAAGVRFIDPVTEAYRALLALYEASTR
jgi:hypothetical protein